jgi:hypothetical protein
MTYEMYSIGLLFIWLIPEIEKLGHVKLYDAFDGAPYCEETSHGRVRFMDLSIPKYCIRQYDSELNVCLLDGA